MSWQPSASIENLTLRANILAQIRQFFADKKVLEVDTPALSHATVTDVHLVSFSTELNEAGGGNEKGKPLYLQTSPEFAMKRLLAAGSGSIYQICKAFRNEESGRFHNPEFTMLEWYRPGFDHFDLMNEMDELLQRVLHTEQADMISYQQAFIEHVGPDPIHCHIDELKQAVIKHELHADWAARETDKDILLQYLFGELVETNIGQQRPCFVYHFPASQAALAKISTKDKGVAERFELYYHGIELANGFHELTDADEQERRFIEDNQKRQVLGLETKPIDHHLISALASGLPDCAGVALGIDRLIMIAGGVDRIDSIMAFGINNA